MFTHKIGYAGKVVNDTALAEEYDGLEVKDGEYLMNQYRATVFAARKDLKDFAEPVDTTKYACCRAVLKYRNRCTFLACEFVFILGTPFETARRLLFLAAVITSKCGMQ